MAVTITCMAFLLKGNFLSWQSNTGRDDRSSELQLHFLKTKGKIPFAESSQTAEPGASSSSRLQQLGDVPFLGHSLAAPGALVSSQCLLSLLAGLWSCPQGGDSARVWFGLASPFPRVTPRISTTHTYASSKP